MIYICSHKPEQLPYKIHCPVEIIDNTKSALPEDYRHLRGMMQVLEKKPLPEEVGIYQHRRFMEYGSIPEGYDCVVPRDFPAFHIRNQYGACHHIEDLDVCEEIINDPDFSKYIRTPSDEQWMHNIFILKKEDYIRYCNFLFSVFTEYEKRTGGTRDVCFLAERLGSYWIWKNIPKEKRFVTKTITLT